MLIIAPQVIFCNEITTVTIGSSFNNIIDYSDEDIGLYAYNNLLAVDWLLINNEFKFQLGLSRDYSWFEAEIDYGIGDISILSESETIYPSISLGYKDSSLELTFNELPEIDLDLSLPIGRYLNLGLQKELKYPLNSELYFSNDETLLINPLIDNSVGSIRYCYDWFYTSIGLSINSISSEAVIEDENTSGAEFEYTSDPGILFTAGINRNNLKLELYGEYSYYNVPDSSLYLFHNDQILLEIDEPPYIEMLKMGLNAETDHLRFSLFYDLYYIDESDCFISTAPIIGSVAYRQYSLSIPDNYISAIGGSFNVNLPLSFMEINFTGAYTRFNSENSGISYIYKDYAWGLFFPVLVDESTELAVSDEWDTINLITLNFEGSIPLPKDYLLTLELNQLIPFTDFSFSDTTEVSQTVENITSDSTDISGGTTISLFLSYKL